MGIKRASIGKRQIYGENYYSCRAKLLYEKSQKQKHCDQKLKHCVEEYEQYLDPSFVQCILDCVFNETVKCSILPINQLIGQYLEEPPHQKFLALIEELIRPRGWFNILHRKNLYNKTTYDISIHSRLKKIIKNNRYLQKKDVVIVIDNYSTEFKKWTQYKNYRLLKLNLPFLINS